MKKRKRNIQTGQIFACILMLLAGVICGVAMTKSFGDSFSDMGIGKFIICLFVFVVSAVLAMYVQIIIHEGGHLLFGLLEGYRFVSFRIGNRMLMKGAKGLEWKRYSLMGTGGQCLMEPPQMRDGSIPYKWYNLGGVLMNLFTAAVFGLLYLLCRQMFFPGILFLLLALTGVVYGLINVIPINMGAVANDGANVKYLGEDKHALYGFWLQMEVAARTTRGERLKDMPEEWFVMPSDDAMQNSMGASAAVFVCSRYIDNMELERAESAIRELLDKDTVMADVHRWMLTSELIYCETIKANGQPGPLCTGDMERFWNVMSKNPSVMRVKYALALFRDENEKAASKIKVDFETMAETYPYSGELEEERQLMEHAWNIYRTRKAQKDINKVT